MTNKQIKKALKRSEVVFHRLITELSVFLETITEEGQVDAKIAELNDKWVDHCNRTPEMIEEGKKEFLLQAGYYITQWKLQESLKNN